MILGKPILFEHILRYRWKHDCEINTPHYRSEAMRPKDGNARNIVNRKSGETQIRMVDVIQNEFHNISVNVSYISVARKF